MGQIHKRHTKAFHLPSNLGGGNITCTCHKLAFMQRTGSLKNDAGRGPPALLAFPVWVSPQSHVPAAQNLFTPPFWLFRDQRSLTRPRWKWPDERKCAIYAVQGHWLQTWAHQGCCCCTGCPPSWRSDHSRLQGRGEEGKERRGGACEVRKPLRSPPAKSVFTEGELGALIVTTAFS